MDKLTVEQNMIGEWDAYYDPEPGSLRGAGKHPEAAIEDLLERTTEWGHGLWNDVQRHQRELREANKECAQAITDAEEEIKARVALEEYAGRLTLAADHFLAAWEQDKGIEAEQAAAETLATVLASSHVTAAELLNDQDGSAKAAGAPGAESTATRTNEEAERLSHAKPYVAPNELRAPLLKLADATRDTLRSHSETSCCFVTREALDEAYDALGIIVAPDSPLTFASSGVLRNGDTP